MNSIVSKSFTFKDKNTTLRRIAMRACKQFHGTQVFAAVFEVFQVFYSGLSCYVSLKVKKGLDQRFRKKNEQHWCIYLFNTKTIQKEKNMAII